MYKYFHLVVVLAHLVNKRLYLYFTPDLYVGIQSSSEWKMFMKSLLKLTNFMEKIKGYRYIVKPETLDSEFDHKIRFREVCK